MSRYLVLIQEDEQKWMDMAEGAKEALEDHYKFNMGRADAVIAGRALQPSMTATSLRADDSGAITVTDGPFVETKEVLGGFYLIEAADDAAALEIAREVPAPFGGLEIRPVQVFGDGPQQAPKDQAEGLNSYVVLLYQDEARGAAMTPGERQDLLERHGAFQARHGGSVLTGDALQPSSTARSVQVGDGSFAVTDGPFAETKEALGGFYILQAGDLDEAIAIARDIPAPHGGIEIRPTMVYS